MDIRMLFVHFGEDGGPELVEAWDEYTIDQNPEGANEAFQKAIDSHKSLPYRFITVSIPDREVERAFEDVRLHLEPVIR